MLAAVKNKPCGWPLARPFLTAAARCGEAFPQAGTERWSEAEQRDASSLRQAVRAAYPLGIQKRRKCLAAYCNRL